MLEPAPGGSRDEAPGRAVGQGPGAGRCPGPLASGASVLPAGSGELSLAGAETGQRQAGKQGWQASLLLGRDEVPNRGEVQKVSKPPAMDPSQVGPLPCLQAPVSWRLFLSQDTGTEVQGFWLGYK